LHPDFVLIGESDARAGDMLQDIYRQVVGPDVAVRRMNFVNAELAKISVNTYVTMKISFANMLSEICHGLPDADADVVTAAIGMDGRSGGKYLQSGTGYGGPCFPRDTVAFVTAGRGVGVDAVLASATRKTNERQVPRLVDLVGQHAGKGDVVAVLGLSYKPGTNVVEESQGLLLATALDRAGYNVVAHDPAAIDAARAVLGAGFCFAESTAEAVAAADVVVLMVAWPEYRDFFRTWRGTRNTKAVIDCWRLARENALEDDIAVVRLGLHSAPDVRHSPPRQSEAARRLAQFR
jgi:UDPglucose 6-dehydrogenase